MLLLAYVKGRDRVSLSINHLLFNTIYPFAKVTNLIWEKDYIIQKEATFLNLAALNAHVRMQSRVASPPSLMASWPLCPLPDHKRTPPAESTSCKDSVTIQRENTVAVLGTTGTDPNQSDPFWDKLSYLSYLFVA